MLQKTIAGKTLDVTPDGFLKNSSDWDKEIAMEIAKELGIQLTEKHFEILLYLRDQHAAGVQLSIRKLGKSGIAEIKELYELFPGGPLNHSSKIAGIPKPVSCV